MQTLGLIILILTEAILKWSHKSKCKQSVLWNILQHFCHFEMSLSHKILIVDLLNMVPNLTHTK